MSSPNRLVSKSPPAFWPIVRNLAPIGLPLLLAMALTVFGWQLLSPSATLGELVALLAANSLVLWFAGARFRRSKESSEEFSPSTAAPPATAHFAASDLDRAKGEVESIKSSLDAFSHSVSHDLRAPLRGILNYTKTVLEDDEKKLSAESKAYLGYSIQAAVRSNELIDRFLELAQSSVKPLDKTGFDLAAMASAAIESLQSQDPSRVVAFVGPKSAKAFGDRSLLRNVIENLLSNAWKFTRKTSDAHIEFSVEVEPQGPVYVIRDNGVGFEMAHVDRLFRNFSRLHTNDDFEGTGIGLSIAHRIVERHGGWIRAQGEPGKGAEFRFWLPPGTNEPV